MAISINGEDAGSQIATCVIEDAVETWLAAKKRRLPNKTHQTGEEIVEQNRLANAANENVSQTEDVCVQTDRNMLKEIVKEEILAYVKAYKLQQEVLHILMKVLMMNLIMIIKMNFKIEN